MLVPKVLECAFLLLISHIYMSLCMSTEKLFDGVLPLSPEDKKLLDSWTEESEQNIWELSGQFEGDIILNTQRNGLIDTDYRWPSGVIPYKFAEEFNLKEKRVIQDALSMFREETCIRPRLATKRDKDYVIFSREKSGCFSKLGKRGGEQVINLEKNCVKHGTILHEFMHTIGFYHQQSSTERDKYVKIFWNNIRDGHEKNFKKYKSDKITNFNQKYDYDSIMHYGEHAFSRNHKKTIIATNPRGAKIGQRHRLSRIDIRKINKMYDCY